MAFPWVSEANFEDGDRGHFDAEVDDDVKLDFPHYTEIARTPGIAMPYRGAYGMRIDLSGGTNPAYVQETAAWDLTAGTGDLYLRFMLWVDPNITMATTNEFAVLQFWSATSTVEAGVYINFTTANGLRIGIGEATATSFLPLTTGEWHAVEVFFDPAGVSASTIDLWLDGGSATQVASFTSADITSGILGATGLDAGTTAGILLFDEVIADEARIHPPKTRFDDEMVLTRSGHAFVGPGTIDNVQLASGNGTDNVLEVYDTDEGDTNDAQSFVVRLSNTAANETVDPAGMPARVVRGCYIKMSGTNPRAQVKLSRAIGWGSDGAVRNYGFGR